jgi:adenylyltransferase/sulfurtransferase
LGRKEDIKMLLSKDELSYYEKQLLLEEITEEMQMKLKNAKVLVIGAGGLGCPALTYLATAGVGNIGIVDFDKISVSNLHRQILYTYQDIGTFKAETAAEKVKRINPFIQVKPYVTMITEDNIFEIIEDYDIILDSPDNYDARYVIEAAGMKAGKTMVYASVCKFEGQVAVFKKHTACYRCVFPENVSGRNEDTDSWKGIYAPLPGIIGAIQASEAIKTILGIGGGSDNILFTFNLLYNEMRRYKIEKNKDCTVCKGSSDNG